MNFYGNKLLFCTKEEFDKLTLEQMEGVDTAFCVKPNIKFHDEIKRVQSKKKVFLGGTCNDSTWRNDLIQKLQIDYFNPVVENWTPECQEEEINQRKCCDFVLYCITPKMMGVYSIAEVVDDSNKRPSKTLYVQVNSDDKYSFSSSQIKSLEAVKKMISSNGAICFDTLKDVAKFLNKQ